MSKPPRRILLTFLNTGGGHSSAAHALGEALYNLYGDSAQVTLVDLTTEYLSWPLNRLDDIYTYLVKLDGRLWAIGYHLSNSRWRVALLNKIWWLLTRRAILQLLRDHPSDVIVCCHPLLPATLHKALEKIQAVLPLITLVTDLTTGHAFWFAPGCDRYLVPTEEALQCALACGLPDEQIEVTGLPVSSDFATISEKEPRTVQQRLGLKPNMPVVLLMGGADGMGAFRRLCRATASSGIKAQLAVITGRNEKLRRKLTAESWPIPVHIKGFVHNPHEWMQAADILVTKAGPSTISEALVMGLPMVLSGALPGQERPNVNYVVQGGAGVWAPGPEGAATAVRDLLEDESAQAQMSKRARALAHPDAAWRVAEIVWNSANGKLA